MNFLSRNTPALAAMALAALGLVGCGSGEVKPMETLTAEEAPKKIGEVFAGAPADARRAATELADSIQSQPADAFFGFQALSYRSDLTPEQSQVVAQAMLTAREKLAAAAANGDDAARQALEQQAARK